MNVKVIHAGCTAHQMNLVGFLSLEFLLMAFQEFKIPSFAASARLSSRYSQSKRLFRDLETPVPSTLWKSSVQRLRIAYVAWYVSATPWGIVMDEAKDFIAFCKPEVLDSRLKMASTFIAIYEYFQDSLNDFVNSLLSYDKKKYKRAAEAVTSRGMSKALYAAFLFLEEGGAITKIDIEEFEEVSECRNKLSHELMTILVSDGLPSNYGLCFKRLSALYVKIERWRARVELDLSPETPDEEIQTGPMMITRMVLDIAFGTPEIRNAYQEIFTEKELTRLHNNWQKANSEV